MVLMTVDHASLFYNTGRVADDSVATYTAGSALPLAQFLTRWVTHICAPTFLFLAGTALALSCARRIDAGHTQAAIRRELLIRGGLIAALDLLYMSALAQHVMLQVLYAIGLSMIAMAFLRHLSDRALLSLALGWFALGELLTDAAWDPPTNASIALAMTVARYTDDSLWIFYPVVPWLAMMMLGWVFGNYLRTRGEAAASRVLVLSGLAALGVFGAVRGWASYGNMWLQRDGDSLQQWLHVSKYPPSLSYAALELGLMALGIAALMGVARRVTVRASGPILLFGQTALFFYIAHFTLLGISKPLLGLERGGLERVYVAAAVVLLVLYPCCLWFRSFKRARPDGWVRFI